MADYAGVLADLRIKQKAAKDEYDALEQAIIAIEKIARQGLPAGRPTGWPNPSPEIRPKQFEGMTMPQAIINYLAQAGGPQTKDQIKKGVLAGGMTGGTNIGSHIYNTLHRLSLKSDGPIRREGDGRWSLRGALERGLLNVPTPG